MPKVFITGVAGFLGSHIAQRFRDLGWEVCGIDNLSGGRVTNVPEGVDFKVIDCLDRAGYLPLMADSALVYHCASTAYDGLSIFSPSLVFKNTAQATVDVASAAIASGVERFVYCSSMARYGALTAPFTEDMEPRPVNPYGMAKRVSEQVVQNLFETHGGTYSIAVPHNIIGPRQRYDDPYRNVASIMINRMLRGLQPIIYGDGSHLRCFSFIQDVLFCLERMGTTPETAGETINIGPDEEAVSILELAERIAELLDFPLDPIFMPDRPLEVRVATCSADKARKLLGYKTSTSLNDGLRSLISWIASQGTAEFSYGWEIEIKNESTPATWLNKLI
ncbi:NAD-dependent epimerase/dehydratase family protein [Streptomyces sp. NPDC029080]|uniref:NAD-dependent epimerase/dehydratase family protein n=1 Tax=Streptomyces sp. NPDC029080 TaxID=3155017 RepID=UPI00340DB9AA